MGRARARAPGSGVLVGAGAFPVSVITSSDFVELVRLCRSSTTVNDKAYYVASFCEFNGVDRSALMKQLRTSGVLTNDDIHDMGTSPFVAAPEGFSPAWTGFSLAPQTQEMQQDAAPVVVGSAVEEGTIIQEVDVLVKPDTQTRRQTTKIEACSRNGCYYHEPVPGLTCLLADCCNQGFVTLCCTMGVPCCLCYEPPEQRSFARGDPGKTFICRFGGPIE